MSTQQVALLALLVVLLLVWIALRGRAAARTHHERNTDRLDTVAGWPPEATRLLNTAERRAFAMLSRALPDHLVLAQVQIARFVSVSKRNSYADWLRRVGYQCVDLVVCDGASQVVAVIELRPPDPTDQSKKRLLRMKRTLEAAGLKVHVWEADALPPYDRIRGLVLPNADPSPPPEAPHADPAPVFELPMVFESTDDLLEPPPSTWYDELDSQKVPLGKRS